MYLFISENLLLLTLGKKKGSVCIAGSQCSTVEDDTTAKLCWLLAAHDWDRTLCHWRRSYFIIHSHVQWHGRCTGTVNGTRRGGFLPSPNIAWLSQKLFVAHHWCCLDALSNPFIVFQLGFFKSTGQHCVEVQLHNFTKITHNLLLYRLNL